MKRFVFLMLAVIAISACNNSELQTQDEFVDVRFNFSGELNINESPLSKSDDAKDWYAFQVYSRAEGSEDYYQRYAYGFFDNTDDMVISLKSGYEYRFDVSMAVDGSEKVYKFALYNAGWAEINNSFVISSTEFVRYMYEGYLYMKYPTWDTYDRPSVDRYFGRTDGFVPVEGTSVNIEMKRSAFGVKFVANDFSEGSLEISVEGAGIIKLNAEDGAEVEEIISFNNIGPYSDPDTYSEDIPVNIVWIKPDGVRTPLVGQTVNFKRNVLTTLEFDVKDVNSASGVNITADEELVIGDTVIADQDGTNTEVNPGQ